MDIFIERAFHDKIQPQRQALTNWLQSFTPLQFWGGLFLFIVFAYGVKIWSIVKAQEDFEKNPPQAYLDYLKRREAKLKAKAAAAAAAAGEKSEQGADQDDVPLIQGKPDADKKHD